MNLLSSLEDASGPGGRRNKIVPYLPNRLISLGMFGYIFLSRTPPGYTWGANTWGAKSAFILQTELAASAEDIAFETKATLKSAKIS